MIKTLSRVTICASLCALTLGCASTTMTKNWVYPEHGPLDFDTIMVVVLVQDPFVRQRGEDELVRYITRAEAVASYTLMPSNDASGRAK